MLDLQSQYRRLKNEIDQAVQGVLSGVQFINGPEVRSFESNLATYLDVANVVGCGNGTDALQIALMCLNLPKDAEIILPAFTYTATAEVIVLLGFTPVFVDVNSHDFNIDVTKIEAAITDKTKAIMPVHLFGQGADMDAVMNVAEQYELYVIEDNAQAIGAEFIYSDGNRAKLGTIGDIGITSFFPTKNLGCFGDGGALFTNNNELATKLRKLANHGQSSKYYHEMIGVNSRLDTLQAAILDVKLAFLSQFNKSKQKIALVYRDELQGVDDVELPVENVNSTHVYHQFTLKVKNGKRDDLKAYLSKKGIQSTIYYPLAIHQQQAYKEFARSNTYPIAEGLTQEALSLPIHTEMNVDDVKYICTTIREFYS